MEVTFVILKRSSIQVMINRNSTKRLNPAWWSYCCHPRRFPKSPNRSNYPAGYGPWIEYTRGPTKASTSILESGKFPQGRSLDGGSSPLGLNLQSMGDQSCQILVYLWPATDCHWNSEKGQHNLISISAGISKTLSSAIPRATALITFRAQRYPAWLILQGNTAECPA